MERTPIDVDNASGMKLFLRKSFEMTAMRIFSNVCIMGQQNTTEIRSQRLQTFDGSVPKGQREWRKEWKIEQQPTKKKTNKKKCHDFATHNHKTMKKEEHTLTHTHQAHEKFIEFFAVNLWTVIWSWDGLPNNVELNACNICWKFCVRALVVVISSFNVQTRHTWVVERVICCKMCVFVWGKSDCVLFWSIRSAYKLLIDIS